MRFYILTIVLVLLITVLLPACVDQLDLSLRGSVDVVVVDGTITNLAEPQIIRINRSKADLLTGRFGTLPLTKASVEVIVDSILVIACHETVDGSYQLPNDFRGQVGHSYQLRLTFADGTRYQSTQQVMPDVPPINKVYARFNPTSLGPTQRLNNAYAAGHDFYLDTQDPADQHNYYRWQWVDYEKQDWCRTCENGLYLIWDLSDTYLYEACYDFTFLLNGQHFTYDYPCRTQCWEVFYSPDVNVFDDTYTNGGPIVNRKVAQIPFYSHNPCLVDIRQLGLTRDAYRYYKLFQDQTQNTGGVADTPPSLAGGNIRNVADAHETIVGYFTASAVSTVHYWLDRKDTQGVPPGLFQSVYGRDPAIEPIPPPIGIFSVHYTRPPTAVCVSNDSRTPYKPVGWQD